MTRKQPMRPAGRLIFVGAVHEAVPALTEVLASGAEIAEVVTLPPERAGATSGFVDLAPLASSHGITVRRCADLNAPGSIEHIRLLRPDLIVVVGWTRLLRAELLAVPRHGCVGFHASLLPCYRGRAPVNWAILRGETVTGNTMMYLDAGTDTGDIIDQQPVPIEPEDTCATVYGKVAAAGVGMLRAHLAALLEGTAPQWPQGPADGPALPKRTPRMGITDWNRSARSVHNWIRALTEPYPGAFTWWGDRKVMLWSSVGAADTGDTAAAASPGDVLGGDARGIRVATAGGSILVTTMSEAGSPPEPASAWALRSGLRTGDAFSAPDRATAQWALGLGPEPAVSAAGSR